MTDKNNSAQYPNQAQISKCVVTKHNGKEDTLAPNMLLSFIVRESLLSPFISAALVVSDSANWINGKDPIEGGETIQINIKTAGKDEDEIYRYRIWKIGNRISINNKQAYTLALVSEEAMKNEVTRVNKRIPGGGQQKDGKVPEMNIKDIITKLLRDYIKTSKPFKSEETKFKHVIIGSNRRPFDIISELADKSVSTKGKVPFKQEESTSSGTKQVVKGTAGFFFWETKRGYNFFSVDAICDEVGGAFSAPDFISEQHGVYKEKIANVEGVDARQIISRVVFRSEVDSMEALRVGKYSTNMIFFNISTGQYEEYQYKVTDSYKNMAHLGNQNKVSELKVGEQKLEAEPSRLITAVLDHERWYNEPGIADPYDPKAEDPSVFADWQKHFAAQSIARKELLKNQEVTIEIPGDNTICAGDKVEIEIQKKAPDVEKEKNNIDEESSGLYLVKDVEHSFRFAEGTSGIVKTTLQLFRDSYGLKDKPTEHGK